MILPPATLGMLGGGQLGRFFVLAAHELGYRVVVLDPDPQSPAGRIADRHLVAAYDDEDALNQMAESCAAVTTEFENVPAGSLAYLSKFLPVRPSAEAVAISQNRSAEKGFPPAARLSSRTLCRHPQRGGHRAGQRRPVSRHPQGGALRL
jgi:5-(carboxyamino)imidazole ribonucleotide synthase